MALIVGFCPLLLASVSFRSMIFTLFAIGVGLPGRGVMPFSWSLDTHTHSIDPLIFSLSPTCPSRISAPLTSVERWSGRSFALPVVVFEVGKSLRFLHSRSDTCWTSLRPRRSEASSVLWWTSSQSPQGQPELEVDLGMSLVSDPKNEPNCPRGCSVVRERVVLTSRSDRPGSARIPVNPRRSTLA